MSEWINCNRCGIRHGANVKFFLTECAHIICAKCTLQIKPDKKCLVCQKPTSVIKLENGLEQNILQFFQPLDQAVNKIAEVHKFQISQRNFLLNHISRKYTYAKKEVLRCQSSLKHAIKEIEALKKELESLRSKRGSAGYNPAPAPAPFPTSTPMSFQNQAAESNASFISSVRNTGSALRENMMPRHGICRSSASSSLSRRVFPDQRRAMEPPVPARRPHQQAPSSVSTMFSLNQLRSGPKPN